jgi:hypothetical protein
VDDQQPSTPAPWPGQPPAPGQPPFAPGQSPPFAPGQPPAFGQSPAFGQPPAPGQPGVAAAGQPGAARRGKRRILIGVLVVVLVCAGLCGIGQLITNFINQDDWEGLGEPVPAPTISATPAPSWSRPNEFVDPKPVLGIRYQLESWVLASAGVARPMSSKCDQPDFTGAQATTMTCTVTYDGHDIAYTVSARPSGSATFTWTGEATQAVVTREGLHALVHRRFGSGDWKDLRCEEFPEVAVVPAKQFIAPVCYAKNKDAIKVTKIKIKPGDQAEPWLEPEYQDEGL